MSYLDGQDKKVVVQMYPGRAIGLSVPTDGNRHNDLRVTSYRGSGVTVTTFEDGTLVSVEVDLPEDVTRFEANVR